MESGKLLNGYERSLTAGEQALVAKLMLQIWDAEHTAPASEVRMPAVEPPQVSLPTRVFGLAGMILGWFL